MSQTAQPNDPIVTKQMHQLAMKGLGSCMRCREKLTTFKQLGFDFPEIEAQVDAWQPKLEGVVQHYQEQLGLGNG